MSYSYCSFTNLSEVNSKLTVSGDQLNNKQISRILNKVYSFEINLENQKRKAVVASILDKIEARLKYLEKTGKNQAITDIISQIRERWEIPNIDREALHRKFKRAVARAKVIGKGATIPGAKIMHEQYWIETITFQVEGKTVRFYGRKLYPHFLEWKASPDTRDFQTVMQEKINNMNARELREIKKIRLKFLTSSELKKHKANFSEGKIYANNQLLQDGEYMFVMDPKHKYFYVGQKKRGHFQHSSFLKGGAIGAAGVIQVKDGKVVGIRNHSGHYRPSRESLDPAIKLLKPVLKLKKGIKSSRKSHHVKPAKSPLWQKIHSFIVSVLNKIRFIKT